MEFLGIRTKSGAIVQPNSGEEMIHKFDFAYSTPGLTTGVVVYNPTVGDILLDAWIEIDTAFNGTTPSADISQFAGGDVIGWFSNGTGLPLRIDSADDFELASNGLLSASGVRAWTSAAGPTSPLRGITLQETGALQVSETTGAFSDISQRRWVPGKFVSSNPVKVVVSQDGTKGGLATGATQGAGTVYFLTGTPQ